LAGSGSGFCLLQAQAQTGECTWNLEAGWEPVVRGVESGAAQGWLSEPQGGVCQLWVDWAVLLIWTSAGAATPEQVQHHGQAQQAALEMSWLQDSRSAMLWTQPACCTDELNPRRESQGWKKDSQIIFQNFEIIVEVLEEFQDRKN
jgi:hypothetical protein